jgi:hypothetical protein
MKKELTSEHLAAYLPYGVKVNSIYYNSYGEVVDRVDELAVTNVLRICTKGENRLFLRPLSQLTETIEHGGERFVPIEVLHRDFPQSALYYGKQTDASNLPYCIMRQLLMWHVDIFDLIEAGLAEPIPSIPQP